MITTKHNQRSAQPLPIIVYFLLFFCAPVVTAENYSPYVDDDFPRNVYWGNTHVHSAFSADAALLGESRLTPEQAYRFARGETVHTTSGQPARMIRPLDFMVLSDHAEYLGLMQQIERSNPLLLDTDTGKRWHQAINRGGDDRVAAIFEILVGVAQPDKINNSRLRESVWQQVTANADRFNDPGKFTAFIGYEWTSTTPNVDGLHRNVIFRDDANFANQILPFSAQHSLDPENLWAFLANYEKTTQGRVMAIAHNGNLSNGLMFSDSRFNGEPIDSAYAQNRARWEPVYEVTQIKGDGETHPLLSPDDEFADYETWDTGNLGLVPKPEGALEHEYARSALKLGLGHEQQLGANPFKFGMIGSTDSHTGLATAREDNFWGKFSKDEPGPDRHTSPVLPPPPEDTERSKRMPFWKSVASGYAGVWARENTRAAIFDAMQRKEVYATTGPRIQVRFFGGWDFQREDIHNPDVARIGYQKGVPMGGDLPARRGSAAQPVFLLSALKDPDGANLDRLQIIKGWYSPSGELRERVFDAAVSDGRKIGRDGRARKTVGNTVDTFNASYSNSIGAVSLAAMWQDPDFDPDAKTFYYVRVIEIPKPRWTAYDAKHYQLEMADDVLMTTQDRAYTSPIWYSPPNH